MPSTSLRVLFGELIDLDASARAKAIAASDLAPEQRVVLEAMLAFDAIVAAPFAQRASLLHTLALDDAVHARLQTMLASDASTPHVLRDAAGEAVRLIDSATENFGAAGSQLIGKRFGEFTLTSLIAEGGSSAVFRAERAVGDGMQVVALKVLRTGLFSREAQRRFGREQAILAQLEHPNIARLIEGGVGESGIPYIAMELVDGLPITRAADARRLGLRQRLAWFATLCRTIEAAHVALVVHRDIKPSNILVTHAGQIKVLDFGIAKLLDDEAPSLTRTIALTPEYAAPEQFGSKPVTMATDVYSLGVLLGELLVGRRLLPHRLASNVVSSGPAVVPAGMPGPHALARLVEGDLDAILAMATAEDPRSRYATAAALADDIERHLAGEPVHARPLTRWYRLSKFVGRHRAGIGIAALLAAMSIAAFVAVAWQAERARQQAVRAEEEAVRARTVRDVLVSIFNAGGADVPREQRPRVDDIVDEAAKRLMRDTMLPDAVRADLFVTLARVGRSVGECNRAIELLDLADRAIDAVHGPQSAQRLESLVLRASSELDCARPSRAEALLAPNVGRLARSAGTVGVDGLLALGKAHIRQGRGEQGLAFLRQAALLAGDGAAPADAKWRALIDQATALIDLQRFGEGLVAADAAAAAWKAAGATPSQAIIDLYSTIALAAEGTGDIPRAERTYREAIELGDRFFDRPNPASAWTVGMYGSFLAAQGRLDDAQPYLQRGLEMRRSVFGPADPRTLNALAAMGKLHAARRDFATAVQWYTQAVDLCAQKQVADVICSRVLAFRARAYAGDRRFAEAERDVAVALAMQRERSGEMSPAYAFVLENKLAIDIRQHSWSEARTTAEQILAINAASGSGMIQSTLTVHYHHALASFELGRVDEALREIEEFEPQYARLFPNGVSRFDMLALRARALARGGRADAARDVAREALAVKVPPAGRNPKIEAELRALADAP